MELSEPGIQKLEARTPDTRRSNQFKSIFWTTQEAIKAMIWPTSGFKDKTFDKSCLSAERENLISASAVLHGRRQKKFINSLIS